MKAILLASSSTYRRELLGKLRLPFTWASPDIDETPLQLESPQQLVERLALLKAKKLAPTHPNTLIISSDQVAVLDNTIIGKPHEHERAVEQLRQSSGRSVTFKTSLCLLNTSTNSYHICTENVEVHFRPLTDAQINHYLTLEQPFDCAGSFKCEGLGIALFQKISTNDPNTLVGLPLIKLTEMLKEEGIDPLLHAR
jgi:MAF protein